MKAKSFSLSIVTVTLVASFISCAPKKADKVSTDLVNISSTASGNAPSGREPEMKFEREMHDFGKISQGERVATTFRFRNTGGMPLQINDAVGSCGCTVPKFPKELIPPGGEGEISVEFNSEGKSGGQQKDVRITTNCKEATKVITIKADVVVPKERGGDGHSADDGHGHSEGDGHGH
ncbi:MAG TPA: DUF1573 domain-containing protein [Bacteroidia bacterium]|nr:DUF1573 domain-containing protein [Bacteroidia bacterium]